MDGRGILDQASTIDKDTETSPSSSCKKKQNTATGMHCMAPGCTNNCKNNTQVHYHRLPSSGWLKGSWPPPPPPSCPLLDCGQNFQLMTIRQKANLMTVGDTISFRLPTPSSLSSHHSLTSVGIAMVWLMHQALRPDSYLVAPIPLLVAIINASIKGLTSWVLVEQRHLPWHLPLTAQLPLTPRHQDTQWRNKDCL